MYQGIIKKINLLIEMSDANNTYEALQEELSILKKDILRLQKKLQELQAPKSDTRYLRASDRLIDENIKISLENKVTKYQEQLSFCLEEIEKVSEEEESYHQALENLNRELESLKQFQKSLELKSKTIGSKDKSSFEFYQNLMENTLKEVEALEEKRKEKEEAYTMVKKRLESYGEERLELETKIQRETEKLEETTLCLKDPNSYIDFKLKREDEQKIAKLTKELEDLERRKLEIVTDPVFIGHDAINYLENEDITSALEKIKELVTIVESKPFMNYQNSELEEVLEDAKTKRDEFASILEGKEYKARDMEIVNNRLDYLKNTLEKKQTEQEQLEKKIHEIDTIVVKDLLERITKLHEEKENLQQEIANYRQVINQNEDFKTPRKKANLKAAFSQKCEEFDFLEELLKRYEKELENTVIRSKYLEENDLMNLMDEIHQIEKEIKEMEHIKNSDNSAQDILAIEKDKTDLKKLSDNVDIILARKQYSKTPMEIFDEIELSLKANEEPKEEKIEEETNDFIDLNDYRIEKVSHQDEDLIPEIEPVSEITIPEPTVIEPITKMDEFALEEEKEQELSFPPRNQVQEKKNRWKVIQVEPIEEDNKEDTVESLIDEQYMVNDFEDTGYISFNDLLEDNHDEN